MSDDTNDPVERLPLETIIEDLVYSDYTILGETSRIDPPTKLLNTSGLKCPHCRTAYIGLVLAHGQRIICGKCGLKITRYGNTLNCILVQPFEKAAKANVAEARKKG